MKGRVGWMAMAVLFLTAVAHATTLTVTDIKVAQRYPWNGLVDITYTVNCDDPTKDVWVYPVGYDADNDKTVTMMPTHLTGDGVGKAVKSGTHRMTWDMATAMGKDYNRAAFSVKMHAFCDAAPYMVIDLSSGSESERYEVSYLAEEPEGGWGEEYRTTKMVFRLILPGRSLSSGTNTLSYSTVVNTPYYFAVYPMTEQQWCLINGGTATSPKYWKNGVSYNNLRGSVLGSKWPTHQQVDANSVCGRMRLRTGMTVDIPTYPQWFRAASADYQHIKVCTPNAWGIRYIGQVPEICRIGGVGYYVFVCGRDFSENGNRYNSYLGGDDHWWGYLNGRTGTHIIQRSATEVDTVPLGARFVVCPVSK